MHLSEAIAVAVIGGVFAILCAVVTGLISSATTSQKTRTALRISQAVTDAKIEELTREVHEHNGFARRMPVVEEQIKVINHRIADLEQSDRNGKAQSAGKEGTV